MFENEIKNHCRQLVRSCYEFDEHYYYLDYKFILVVIAIARSKVDFVENIQNFSVVLCVVYEFIPFIY